MTRLYLAGGMVVVTLLLALGIYWKGYSDGKARIQARWDAAENAMLDKSIEARDEAEAAIPSVADGAGPVEPCRVPDAYDRDCD